MIYTWASASDVGLLRDHNEDAVHPQDDGQTAGLLVAGVADGLGGHVGGEVASRLALQAAVAEEGPPGARVAAANSAVVRSVIQDPRLAGMGTTLTLGIFDDDGTLAIGHVGDSRAYLYRSGRLRQLTTDHSLVAELLEAGKIRPEEVETHPHRSVVTRALGMGALVEADELQQPLEDGDRVLLCTDGLTTMVPDDAIEELLEESPTPTEAVWALVEAANKAGGADNVSVVVVDVTTE
ncbi:MAG: SpoIIE family protein phosphatase [Acidimicrobiia bacterium]